MTSAEDVLTLLDALSVNGVVAWLCGGWAIEAQIPKARRAHADIDLAVLASDLGCARAVVEDIGYTERPDPNDPCEHLRFGRRREGVVVQVASVRRGCHHDWLSVPASGNRDSWLACPLDGFPTEARGRLLQKLVRCVTPEVLLQSKLSWSGDRGADQADIAGLQSALTQGQIARAKANREPRHRSECDRDCAGRGNIAR